MQVLEFKDFSGGLTDKDIPGRTNRYSRAKNFLIDSNKQIFTRDGFDIFSSTAYQMPQAERISRLVNFDTNSELLAFHNKKAQYISGGAWTELTGPTGNKAFNTNTAASLLTEAQWNHHLYMASDSGDPVVKIYRDSGNTLRLRSAGLPDFVSAVQGDAGLADAIALANDLLSNMKTHMQSDDGDPTVGPNNSATGHHYAHATLTAQYNTLNALSNATNLATLISNLNTMRTVFNEHVTDAQKEIRLYTLGVNFKDYHATPDPAVGSAQPFRQTLNFSLLNKAFSIPSTYSISEVLPFVNDLRDKWNWHTYAIDTHYNAYRLPTVFITSASEYWIGIGAHATSLPRVQTYTWAKITPNYTPFIQYIKDIKSEYDAHRVLDAHWRDDTYNAIPSQFPTTPSTFQDAVTLLGAMSYFLGQHTMDADQRAGYYISFTGDVTSGSPNITNVASISYESGAGSTLIAALNGLTYIPVHGTGSSPYTCFISSIFPINTTVSSTGGTTATMSANSTVSQTGVRFVVTNVPLWHYGFHSTLIHQPTNFSIDLQEQDYTLGSAAALQSIMDLGEQLATNLKNHELDRMTQASSTTTFVEFYMLQYSGRIFYTYYPSDNTQANITQYTPHAPNTGTAFGSATVFPSAVISNKDWKETHFTDTAATAVSINYKACFRYDYTVGASSFTDRGATSEPINIISFTTQEAEGSGTEQGTSSVAITNLYSYTNASNENWATGDTTNFLKEVYRTVGNGTDYYRIDVDGLGGSVPNSTTSVNDVSVDSYLTNQLALYTNGGVVDNDRPPAATYIHQVDGRMYYVQGRRIYVSIPNDPDSVPGDFFDELEENCTGVCSSRSNVVAFTFNKVFRLEGFFNELGQGFIRHESIFDKTGCISAPSIVQADNGIFFAGKDGFYYTDGIQCLRVSDISDTFKDYTNTSAKRNRIQGTYDPLKKLIYWTVQSNNAGSSPDTIWVMDLQFGIVPDGTPITVFQMEDSFNPAAVTIYQDALHFGDSDGYVFKQVASRYIDAKKNTAVAATSWDARTIMYSLKSCNGDYGSPKLRKYFTRVDAQFQQFTNLSLQIVSDSDKGRIESDLPIIRSRKLTDWGDSKLDWISSVYTAKPGDVIDEFRRFKGDGSLRSNYRAIEFKNAYCVIVKSDDMGLLSISSVSANVWALTLANAPTRKWPLYSVDYYVRIAGVDYPVTVRTSDAVVRVSDSGLTPLSVQVGVEWEMWGYPKNEKAHIIQFSVSYEPLGETQKDYQGVTSTDGGENG